MLDCGANVGVFAASALARGAAKVIAIEPSPQNLEALKTNLKEQIGAGPAVVCPKGV